MRIVPSVHQNSAESLWQMYLLTLLLTYPILHSRDFVQSLLIVIYPPLMANKLLSCCITTLSAHAITMAVITTAPLEQISFV